MSDINFLSTPGAGKDEKPSGGSKPLDDELALHIPEPVADEPAAKILPPPPPPKPVAPSPGLLSQKVPTLPPKPAVPKPPAPPLPPPPPKPPAPPPPKL